MSVSSIASRHALVVARRSAERGATLNLLELTQSQLDLLFHSAFSEFDKAYREPNGDVVASYCVDGDPEATWTVCIGFEVNDKSVTEVTVGQHIKISVIVEVLLIKQRARDTDEETLDSSLEFDFVVPNTLSALVRKVRTSNFVQKAIDSVDLDRSRLLNPKRRGAK